MFHSAEKINFSYRDSLENRFDVDFAIEHDKLKVVKNLAYDQVFRPSICSTEQFRQRLNILRSFIFGEKIRAEKIPSINVFSIQIKKEKVFCYNIKLEKCKLLNEVVCGTVCSEKLLYGQKLLLYMGVDSERSLLTDFSDYKLKKDVSELFSVLFQFINFNFTIGENR